MSTNITIDLLKSEHADSFSPDERVHSLEFSTVIDYINNFVSLAKQYPSKDNLHQAITILGSRGSGKTSFLLNICEHCKKNFKVEVLDIIDPTLIEEKGHVFLSVLSAISEIVDNTIDESALQRSDFDHFTKKDWRNRLMRLANGIPSIDGIGNNNADNWMDPEFVMDAGLTAVSASRNLKKHFNELIDYALKILGKDAFVLTFDDIDVDSTKGWAVLECIRKYFTSSRLIVLLSGDMHLYSTVVRQKKWMNFGSEILKYEATEHKKPDGLNPRLDVFNEMIVELSSQYMLKVMPPKYRVHLTTLLEKKQLANTTNINVRNTDQSLNVPLESFYDSILEKFGIANPTQAEVFRTFLLSLPLRSQIQFLARYCNQIDSDFGNGIIDIFLAELQEKGVDINLTRYTSKFINSVILKLLVKNRRLTDLYQLQPITTDASLNSSLFTLNFILSSAIGNAEKVDRNRFLIFDYFIRVAYLRNLLNVIPYLENNRTFINGVLRPSIEELCDRASLYSDVVLRDMTGHIQGYLYGVLNPPLTSQHTNYFIRLLGLEEKAKKGYSGRLDTVFSAKNTKSLLEKTLGYIPAYITTFSFKGASNVSYSIYMLLATVGELIKRHEVISINKSNDEKVKEIVSALINLSQLRSYPVSDFDKKNSTNQSDKRFEITDSEIETEEEYEDTTDLDEFAKLLIKWQDEDESILFKSVAPHLIGKIFTRFYYALENIDSQFSRTIKLGQLVNYQIIAFFNAVIIEDCLEHLQNESKLRIDNTIMSNHVFLSNLQKLNLLSVDKKEKLSLSIWMLSCPLFLCYVDLLDTELKDKLAEFTGKNLEELKDLSIFDRLNQVHILNSDFTRTDDISNFQILRTGDATLSKKGREPELISKLIEEGYPRLWFEDKGIATNRESNKLISKYLYVIFGKEGNSGDIRRVRQFLRENPSLWP